MWCLKLFLTILSFTATFCSDINISRLCILTLSTTTPSSNFILQSPNVITICQRNECKRLSTSQKTLSVHLPQTYCTSPLLIYEGRTGHMRRISSSSYLSNDPFLRQKVFLNYPTTYQKILRSIKITPKISISLVLSAFCLLLLLHKLLISNKSLQLSSWNLQIQIKKKNGKRALFSHHIYSIPSPEELNKESSNILKSCSDLIECLVLIK